MCQTNGINNKHTVHRTPPPPYWFNQQCLFEWEKKNSIPKPAIKNVGPRIRLGIQEKQKTNRYKQWKDCEEKKKAKRIKKTRNRRKRVKRNPFSFSFFLLFFFVLVIGNRLNGFFFFWFKLFLFGKWEGTEIFFLLYFTFDWCREEKKMEKKSVFMSHAQSLMWRIIITYLFIDLYTFLLSFFFTWYLLIHSFCRVFILWFWIKALCFTFFWFEERIHESRKERKGWKRVRRWWVRLNIFYV